MVDHQIKFYNGRVFPEEAFHLIPQIGDGRLECLIYILDNCVGDGTLESPESWIWYYSELFPSNIHRIDIFPFVSDVLNEWKGLWDQEMITFKEESADEDDLSPQTLLSIAEDGNYHLRIEVYEPEYVVHDFVLNPDDVYEYLSVMQYQPLYSYMGIAHLD